MSGGKYNTPTLVSELLLELSKSLEGGLSRCYGLINEKEVLIVIRLRSSRPREGHRVA